MSCDSPLKLVPMLENHEKGLRLRDGDYMRSDGALFSKAGLRGRRSGSERGKTVDRRFACFGCGEEGHKKADCPQRERWGKQSKAAAAANLVEWDEEADTLL